MVKIEEHPILGTNISKSMMTEQAKTVKGGSISVDEKLYDLPQEARNFVAKYAYLCQPDQLHLCNGSDRENKSLLDLLQKDGLIEPLPKYENCWLARTDPADVARVEGKTFIVTPEKRQAIPIAKEGVQGKLGNWMSEEDLETATSQRFNQCMKGRTMYVIPFSMGPVGSPLSKIGIQLTDSAYVVVSMRIMTRMGKEVANILKGDDFVKCLHSVGVPLPLSQPLPTAWPCNPQQTIVTHLPSKNEIRSFGSGYGGNSLLGKKCFALRIGSTIAKREGWFAEHMLILGITNPHGVKKYIAAAFPSACGKTNLAMMNPTLPGYKIECVGDDIAWMKFDDNGVLRAINPENGFFGVAPGTSQHTNPNAMETISKNTIFTNVAKTDDGGVYWEGMGEMPECGITSWKGQPWTPDQGIPAAHPNSRFCTPAGQCPIIDPEWESPEGVPIEAILFGGRRPEGVPLIYEAFDWEHGVFVGSAMRSEATAAAEFKGKMIMNDPMAMRPFFGYNFGHYLDHWLSFAEKPGLQLPKIFHVNWFRKGDDGKFLWPGFGENSRVLDWIFRRLEGEEIVKESLVGLIPKEGTMKVDDLPEVPNMEALFRLSPEFWKKEVESIRQYYEDQVGDDLPAKIADQLKQLEDRIDVSSQ